MMATTASDCKIGKEKDADTHTCRPQIFVLDQQVAILEAFYLIQIRRHRDRESFDLDSRQHVY